MPRYASRPPAEATPAKPPERPRRRRTRDRVFVVVTSAILITAFALNFRPRSRTVKRRPAVTTTIVTLVPTTVVSSTTRPRPAP